MTNESIQEDLNLPVIGGKIVAIRVLRDDQLQRAYTMSDWSHEKEKHLRSEIQQTIAAHRTPAEDIDRYIDEKYRPIREKHAEVYGWVKKFSDETLEENFKYEYKVFIWYDGPDRRYNGACASFFHEDIDRLAEGFRNAYSVIDALKSIDAPDGYSKNVYKNFEAEIEVCKIGGAWFVSLIIESETQRLSKSIEEQMLPELIEKINLASSRGSLLAEKLKLLSAIQ